MTDNVNYVPEDLVRYWRRCMGAVQRCRGVYEQYHLIEEQCCFRRLECRPFKSNGTVAAVSHNEDKIIITFRGTNPANKQAVYHDVQGSLVQETFLGRVHSGARQQLDHLWYTELEPYIEKLLRDDASRDIYLEGHSLGAMMAAIAYGRLSVTALRHEQFDRIPEGLVTFGKPMTGDGVFSARTGMMAGIQRITGNIEAMGHIRFINSTDFISRSAWARFGKYQDYRHGGVPFMLFNSGRCQRDPYRGQRVLEWVRARFRGPVSAGFSDHQIGEYVAAMEQLKIKGDDDDSVSADR